MDDCDDLGVITVAASFGSFIGRIPEADLDLTWSPPESASAWTRTLTELPPDDLFDVADDGTRGVIGFVWAGPSTRRAGAFGEIKGLYVLPTQQRRGVGRRLISHVARQLQERSIASLLVGCVRENPSCGFYRRLGGVEAFREPSVVDRYQTEEIFFFWPDTRVLV
ncbi:MAG TPA: GNAT family N-acetyltransferase [Acidimicrobiales bacterium]|nr:GNAT family N-acetyltransferase [Acidimicrobiales bacterium]